MEQQRYLYAVRRMDGRAVHAGKEGFKKRFPKIGNKGNSRGKS
jgi:hypothetical protein